MRTPGNRVAGTGNYCVLLRRDNISLPFGNRMKTPIFREVRSTFSKIIIMCPNLI